MNDSPERISALIARMPVAATLGLAIDQIGVERSVIRMPIAPSLTFDGVTVQGGIVATLADFAAVACAGAAVRPDQFVATTGVQTHHLAPAAGTELVAVGRLISKPGRTMVAAADVHLGSADGPLCLTGLFTATGIPAPERLDDGRARSSSITPT